MDKSKLKPGQRLSVEYLDGPLLICAGAGSGKTFTLTQRVAAALIPGSGTDGNAYLDTIDQALIITFTEAAATELRDRIRSTLRAEGLASEALKVDGAWISTIHGMCNRVLHEHALEFGIDPDYRIIMDVDQQALTNEAIARVLERTDEDDDRYRALFETYGTATVTTMLESVLSEAASQTTGLQAFTTGPAAMPRSALAREQLVLCEQLQPIATGKTIEYIDGLIEQLNSLLSHQPFSDEAYEQFLAAVKTRSIASHNEEAAALRASFKAARATCALDAVAPLAHDLLDLAQAVDARYQQMLQERAAIDTSGLIRRTLRAFDEHPAIADAYTDRFKLIMVDEFQDTSQLQIDLIERIAGPRKTHLCTVGDSQQSIYRFQGADVSVYLKHKRDMASAGAKTARLTDNFRSHADILAFVRAVCGQPDYFQEPFLDLDPASSGKPFLAPLPRVEVSLVTHPSGMAQAGVTAEARHIAQRFAQMRDAGHSAREMVLLLGTTANAPLYAQALQDQGFSCVTAGGSKYFESIHVAHCQNLMNVLANPYDSQCLLDVLASEVLPVSSDDLLYLSTCLREDTQKPTRQNPAIGFLRDECAPMRSSALLDHAIHVLKRAWGRLGAERPAEVFLHAVVDSGWLARLQAGGIDGRSQAADVLKFVRLIADAQQDVGFDMARTAQKTAALFACGKEKKGALSVDEEDAVRIMTVHGSKGLEFPIVAIASCYLTGSRRDTATMLTFDGAVHLSLKPPGKSPDLPNVDTNFDPARALDQATYRASIVQEDDAREHAEKRRLFYVAATRASAALIVSIRHTTTKDNRYKQVEGDILAGLCPGADDFPAADGIIDYGGDKPLTFTRINLAKDEEATAEEPVSANDEPTQVAIPVLRPQPHIALNPVPLRADFFSYSSIAPHAAAPAPVDSVRDNGVAASIADAEAEEAGSVREVADADKATEFGSALHRTCEWLALQPNFPDEATRAAALDRFGRAFAIHDEARLRAAFDRWVSSDICARAFAHAQHQPEVPFCIEINGEVLEGEIDLLCTEAAAGEALIIDYKTGGSPAETSEVLQDKHRLQAQCYAFATLNRGWNAVELRFVRVEQAEAARSDQPQVVAYRFTADDLPALEQAIAAARHAAS